MDAKELAKKEPMAAPGFTVITPKEETDYDRMIMEKYMSQCIGCEGERPLYPAPAPPAPTPEDVPPEDVPATGKKSTKR
jgi:hypothetical protein